MVTGQEANTTDHDYEQILIRTLASTRSRNQNQSRAQTLLRNKTGRRERGRVWEINVGGSVQSTEIMRQVLIRNVGTR